METMRRIKQRTSKQWAKQVLNSASTGILGMIDKEGRPYQVPLNFVLEKEHIYFHCAKQGFKIDCIQHCEHVSLCVLEKDEVLQEQFATHYGSVLVQGRATLVEKEEEKRHALQCLIDKYCPAFQKEGQKEIQKDFEHCAIIRMDIEATSGKVSKDRMNQIEAKGSESNES